MDWGTLLAFAVGGVVTITAQGVQAYWNNRTEVRRRADQAAEELRAVAAEVRREARHEEPMDVSDGLEEQMTVEYLPRMRTASGYIARRKVRDEVEELIEWLDRWLPILKSTGTGPRRARWLILGRMDELLSAYRRHQLRLPPEWPFERDFRTAIAEDNEWQAEVARLEAAQRQRSGD